MVSGAVSAGIGTPHPRPPGVTFWTQGQMLAVVQLLSCRRLPNRKQTPASVMVLGAAEEHAWFSTALWQKCDAFYYHLWFHLSACSLLFSCDVAFVFTVFLLT